MAAFLFRWELIMAATVLLRITIDHEMIIAWAQRRGALPSTFEGDERPWPLKFSVGSIAAGLVEIVELAIRTGISIDEREIGPLELLEELVPADLLEPRVG